MSRHVGYPLRRADRCSAMLLGEGSNWLRSLAGRRWHLPEIKFLLDDSRDDHRGIARDERSGIGAGPIAAGRDQTGSSSRRMSPLRELTLAYVSPRAGPS